MKISKLQKEVIVEKNKCRITVEIEIDPADFETYDYDGWDKIKDEDIPDILVALGRMYARRIKNGKILTTK